MVGRESDKGVGSGGEREDEKRGGGQRDGWMDGWSGRDERCGKKTAEVCRGEKRIRKGKKKVTEEERETK